MKKSKLIYYIISVLGLSLGLFSCERKELYYPPRSKVRLITHWETELKEKPHYNEVIFYSTEGDGLYRYYIEKDTMLLSVPIGEYHVILYNWRTNASAQTVQFKNHHQYTEMKSFTGLLFNKSGYFDNYDLYLAPDMLFSWTTEEHINSKVVTYASKNDELTLHTYPRRVVHDYNFHVEVIGLEYVRAVSAVSVGFAQKLTMYNKSGIEKEVGHKLNIKVTDVGFQCNFSAYNHFQPNDQKLHFVIKLPDGSFREYFRDINQELDEKGTIEHVEKIVIEFDGTIDPPSGGGGFEPPEIGDWEGIEEDIVFPS
ncbi:MAG: DUF5119 domain-containing protein [Bacteroidales bacterium]